MVTPLWAVTVIVAVWATPATKALRMTLAETKAEESAALPDTVTEVTELATAREYARVFAEKAGERVPLSAVRVFKSALLLVPGDPDEGLVHPKMTPQASTRQRMVFLPAFWAP